MSIKKAQTLLNKALGIKLIVDGINGKNTTRAILDFQHSQGIILSGLLDQRTIDKLATYNDEKNDSNPVKSECNSDIADIIIDVAKQYVGLVEIESNKKWDDLKTPEHDKRAKKLVEWLKKSGHQDGWPYCMSFVEAIYREAYEIFGNPPATQEILKAITPSVMNSYETFEKLGKITKVPTKGAIGFMRKNNSWAGHAFIVEKVEGDTIYTIEGNTSATSATIEADRNGDLNITKTRPLEFNKWGLRLVGFVNPYTE